MPEVIDGGRGATPHPATMLTVAHRAGNRLIDLRAALASTVDLVETDVHLLHGTLQVRHGAPAMPHVAGRRRIPAAPTLEEILTVADRDPRLLLDLKGPSPAVAAAVAALLHDRVPDVPVTVCARQWHMFDAFAADPLVRSVYTAGNWWQLNRLRARTRRAPVYAVSVRRQLLTPEIVTELRRTGAIVLVWPVHTPAALADARRLGASGVIGKDLAMLCRVR